MADSGRKTGLWVICLSIIGVATCDGDRTKSAVPAPPVVAKAPPPPEAPGTNAEAACRQLLKLRLHYPDSVEFLDFDVSQHVEPLGSDTFRTTQRVRARTPAGGMRTQTYVCTMRWESGSVRLLDLQALN